MAGIDPTSLFGWLDRLRSGANDRSLVAGRVAMITMAEFVLSPSYLQQGRTAYVHHRCRKLPATSLSARCVE
jgi:hypothetical protein